MLQRELKFIRVSAEFSKSLLFIFKISQYLDVGFILYILSGIVTNFLFAALQTQSLSSTVSPL